MWDPELARQDLASGKFDGYVKSVVRDLLARIPYINSDEVNDLQQEFRIYALEAIDDFDPVKHPRTAFTTYLYGHLKLRAMQWFNWSWQVRVHPKDAGVFPFSAYEGFSSEEEGTFDPTRIRDDPSTDLELAEFLSSLSPRSARILRFLFGLSDEQVTEAFKLKAYAEEVSRLTGFPVEEVRTLASEVRVGLPRYLSSVGA